VSTLPTIHSIHPFIRGEITCLRVWRRRKRPRKSQLRPRRKSAPL